LHLHWGNN